MIDPQTAGHNMSRRIGPSASGNSFAPSVRLGPTANSMSHIGMIPKSGGQTFAPVGQIDDDDHDLDDHLHTFTAADRKDLSSPFDITSWRGWANGITLLILLGAIIGIFALYPLISFYYTDGSVSGRNTPGYNLGGVNATGQIPAIPGLPSLVDSDTPTDVYTRTGFDGNEWTLVFSDEFNVDGRTFYPGGEDPSTPSSTDLIHRRPVSRFLILIQQAIALLMYADFLASGQLWISITGPRSM